MGKAILKAWLKTSDLKKITVIQPSLSSRALFANHPQVTFYAHARLVPPDVKPDALVLAFKPQQLSEAMEQLRPLFPSRLLVSLLAGTPVSVLRDYAGNETQCARLMPNVGVQIGQGASLVYWPGGQSAPERRDLESLFGGTGKLYFVSSEKLLDSLTVISGCGPAYFYLLAELLTKIATDLGLDQTNAHALVQQTLLGSALITNTHDPFSHLISTVASKGGVTEAALSELKPGLTESLAQAVKAALQRLLELQT